MLGLVFLSFLCCFGPGMLIKVKYFKIPQIKNHDLCRDLKALVCVLISCRVRPNENKPDPWFVLVQNKAQC